MDYNSLPEGYRLLWYEIRSILGRGGFGITYLAVDTNLQQQVAIKEFFPSELATRSANSQVQPSSHTLVEDYRWGLSRFITEAQTLAQFKHKNIIGVRSVFEANQTAYMVMEYLHGQTFGEALRSGSIGTEQEFMNVLLGALDGLGLIHEAGYIHRDIKPENIYLREDGTPVLLDFGSARLTAGSKTRTLTTIFTPGYAPFEQYGDQKEGDRQGPWTDIYSLAATIYRGVAGKGPTDVLSRVDAKLKGSDDPLVAAMSVGSGRFSRKFLLALDRGLALQPGERPQSIEEWRALFLAPDADATVIRPPTAARTAAKKRAPATPGAARISAALKLAAGIAGIAILLAAAYFVPPWIQSENDGARVGGTAPAPPRPGGPAGTVEELLAHAKDDLAANRLTSPEGRNALARFRRVLELDPENAAALGGLEELTYRFIGLADSETYAGRFERAERHIATAASISADSKAVRSARERLDQSRRAAEQTAQEARRRASEVQRLVDLAADDVQANRLTEPPGRNAVERYRAVLLLDPSDEVAREGIRDIALRYVSLAGTAIAARRLEQAARFLDTAERVSPGLAETAGARSELASARSTEAAAAERRERAAQARERKIERLLEQASAAMAEGRLVSPLNENALGYHREVLGLDPDNEAARAGIDNVVARLAARATAAVEAGRLDAASREIRALEGIAPDAGPVAEAKRRLAVASAEAERLAREKAERESRLAALVGQARAHVRAGRLAAPAGNNALEALRSALEIDPDSAEAQRELDALAALFVQRAERALESGDPDAADAHAGLALEIVPGLASADRLRKRVAQSRREAAQVRAARIETLLAEGEAALRAERVSAPAGNNALERFRAVLALDPGNAVAREGIASVVEHHLALAEAARANESLEEAEKQVAAAEEADSSSPGITIARARLQLTRRSVESRLESIAILFAAADRDLAANRLVAPPRRNALHRYREVLGLDPGNERARMGIADVAAREIAAANEASASEAFDEAQALIDSAAAIDTDAPGLDAARERLSRARRDAQARDRDAKIRSLLAAASKDLRAGRLDEPRGTSALDRYREVLALDAGNAEAARGIEQVALAHVAIADSAARVEDFERARRSLEAAAAAAPDARAVALARQRLESEERAAERRHALALERRRTIDRLLALAGSDLEAGRLDTPGQTNAAARYRDVLRIDPDNARARQGLGEVASRFLASAQTAIGAARFDEARELLRRANALDADQDKTLASTVQRLERAEAAERRRLAEEAEKKRLAEEAEKKRLAREAEKKRLAEEAEKKRLAEEAEKRRVAQEKRLAAEAERRRQDEARRRAAEAEKQRLAEEAEKRRVAQEKRLAAEAERRRQDEARRRAAEAEKKRLAEEADKRRVAQEKRLAAEAERRRQEEARRRAAEAEKKRLAEEAEKRRLDEERRIAAEAERRRKEEERRRAEEAEKQRTAKAAEEKRLAEEARKRREAEEAQKRRVAAERAGAEIERLLADADKDYRATRLTTPRGSNAAEKYRRVLSLDSGNRAAEAGLDRIVDRYIAFADTSIRRRQFAKAEGNLRKAETVRPGDDRIAAARERLDEERKSDEQLASTTRVPQPAPAPAPAPTPAPAPAPAPTPAPTPAPAPALSASDLMGKWCSSATNIEVTRNAWTFLLPGGQRVTYRIEGFRASGERIVVSWTDPNQGAVTMELGRFAPDGNSMVHIRGRLGSGRGWQTYNRKYRRC